MALRLSTENADLIKQGWQNELWEESQERDIYSSLTGTSSDKKTMPDGIINRIMLPNAESRDQWLRTHREARPSAVHSAISG